MGSANQRISKTARNILSTRRVATVKEPGQHGDGGGLYLQVQDLGDRIGKSWVFRYTSPATGKRREMGLGPLVDVSLAEARQTAADHRRLLRGGGDPLMERQQHRAAARLESARAINFSEACAGFITAHKASWKNDKHAAQWKNTLATYAEPVIGKLLVADIGTGEVLRVLEPIWNSKRETARRLRSRMERVFSWAAAHEYRSGDNPARWAGNLKDLLPSDSGAVPVKHHSALPYTNINEFVVKLRKQPGIAAQALEFLILTAARTNEAIAAQWSEIDLEQKVWTVPAERMKTGKEHRVPLGGRAVEILEGLPRIEGSPYLFPGMRRGKHLSNMAMLTLLQKRMGHKGVTVHGFRSTFRDWAGERTNYANHIAEMALAHAISDQVEAAYRRGDLIEQRTRMMKDWAKFIELKPEKGANVTPIRGEQA